MAEEHLTTGSEKNSSQSPPALESESICEACGEEKACTGKRICFFCDKEQQGLDRKKAEKQKLIEERTDSRDLLDLVDEATYGLESFCRVLDDTNEYNEIVPILTPLLDRLDADIERIGQVVADTLGNIRILVCTSHMDDDGKQYVPGAFYKAILEPKEIPGGTGSLQ